jgi:hypothetical protein
MQLEHEVPSREMQTCESASSGNQERGKRQGRGRRICERVRRDREVHLSRTGFAAKEVTIFWISTGAPLKNA